MLSILSILKLQTTTKRLNTNNFTSFNKQRRMTLSKQEQSERRERRAANLKRLLEGADKRMLDLEEAVEDRASMIKQKEDELAEALELSDTLYQQRITLENKVLLDEERLSNLELQLSQKERQMQELKDRWDGNADITEHDLEAIEEKHKIMEEDYNGLQHLKKNAEAKIKELTKQLARRSKKLADLTKELAEQKARTESAEQELAKHNTELDGLHRRLRTKEERIVKLEKQLAEQKEQAELAEQERETQDAEDKRGDHELEKRTKDQLDEWRDLSMELKTTTKEITASAKLQTEKLLKLKKAVRTKTMLAFEEKGNNGISFTLHMG